MFLSTRSLALSMGAFLCAGVLGAQEMNSVPAVALGPKIISRSSGETVTVDFGLKPLVHGPYVLAVLNLDSPGATIRLNGTEIFRPEDFSILEISKRVTLSSANTLEVTFDDDRRDSSVIVSITGWEYMYASAYPSVTNTVVPGAYPNGSVDWRTKGVVTPVKNQGSSCPASWAFSTTGAVEGYGAIAGRGLRSLSEQQILDCSGVRSCFLGNTDKALNYVLGAGLTSEAEYPYIATLGACKSSTAVSKITGFERVPIGNENALGAAVDIEPISVVINGNWFSSYTSGVATPDCESHIPVFASALIVGYGTDSNSGLEYWMVKNSLGVSWGESGYFRIVRGQNKCGIADYALRVY
jgi:hypothetical protein